MTISALIVITLVVVVAACTVTKLLQLNSEKKFQEELKWIKELLISLREFNEMENWESVFESDIEFESESFTFYSSKSKQLVYTDNHGETHRRGLNQISGIHVDIDTATSEPTFALILTFKGGEELVVEFTRNLNHAVKFLILVNNKPTKDCEHFNDLIEAFLSIKYKMQPM